MFVVTNEISGDALRVRRSEFEISYRRQASVHFDHGWFARKIPETNVLEVGGVSIYVLHILETLDLKPEAAGFSAVIYGHSHVPKQEVKNNVLYFNPGAAGPRRFKLPVSLGKLVVKNGEIRGEIKTLDVA